MLLIFSTSPTGAVSPQLAFLAGKFIFGSSCRRLSQAETEIDFGTALLKRLGWRLAQGVRGISSALRKKRGVYIRSGFEKHEGGEPGVGQAVVGGARQRRGGKSGRACKISTSRGVYRNAHT